MKNRKFDQVDDAAALSGGPSSSTAGDGTGGPLSVAPGTHPVPGTGGALSVSPGIHPVPAGDDQTSPASTGG
jgi:hypothetical protein